MAIMDRIPTPELALITGDRTVPEEDLREAEQLVDDLAALVEAGVVVVRRQLGGPLRYGLAAAGDGANPSSLGAGCRE